MSSFSFLKSEWPDVCEAAEKAAAAVHPDPRAACFYARRALELAIQWLYGSAVALRIALHRPQPPRSRRRLHLRPGR